MKYLLVILLVALLLVMLLRRLRPYLRMAQQFIRTLRQVQQMNSPPSGSRVQTAEKLVRCETCGTWIPSGRALTSGPMNSVFCSQTCLNPARRPKQSAS